MSSEDYKNLRLKNYCQYFLETGYYMGSGTSRAIQAGFEKILSIEISSIHVENGLKIHKNEILLGQVEIIKEDSRNLSSIISKYPTKRFLFFLDAHADQSLLHEKSVDCPIIDELEAIRNHPIKDHVILVDDMRLFRSQSAWANGILVDNIIKEIYKINPHYKITYLKGVTDNDVLCASIY